MIPRRSGLLAIIKRLRHRIAYIWLERFGQRCYEQTYRGSGDYSERRGWLYRGKFYPLERDDDNEE